MIAFLFQAAGFDAEAYDGLMAALGRADVNAPSPNGFVAHLAGPTADGWRVVDVWQSEDAANAFYGSEQFQAMLGSAPIEIATEPWPLHRAEIDATMRHAAV